MFVNDNLIDVIIDPQARVDWRPKSAAFAVRSRLQLGAAGSTVDLDLGPLPPLCFTQVPCIGEIRGNLPAGYVPPMTGTFPLVQTFRITQPSAYARTVFIEALAAADVTVRAATVTPNPTQALPARDSYNTASRVAELVSHPTGTTPSTS